MEFFQPPTKLDIVLSLLQKTATVDTQTGVHAMSVRIPTVEYYTIEALAEHSGHSRNKIICQLLDVALEEVFAGLDAENAEAVGKIRTRLIQQHLEKVESTPQPQAEPGEC